MDSHRSSIRWAIAGLGLSLVLIVIKVAGYLITGSVTVLSDALESSVHVVTSTFALFAVWLSSRPGDHNHPYGHGKIEYLSAGLEGTLVLLTGLAVIGVAIKRFIAPIELPDMGIGALVELTAAVLAFVGGTALAKAGRRNNSPTIEADGIHIRSDAFTSFAGAAGVGIVALTGLYWLDPLLALGLGIYLIWSGGRIVRSAVGGIMDEARPELLSRIIRLLESTRAPGWLAPHALKVHRLGQSFHIDLHLVFPRYWDLERAHAECHRFTDVLHDEFGMRIESMIHAEPCGDMHCPHCDVADCPIRKSEFVGRLEWTVRAVSSRHQHEFAREAAVSDETGRTTG